MMQSKICTKCGEEKPVEDFGWRRKNHTRQAACRQCNSEEFKAYYLANRKKNIEKVKKWNRDNRERHYEHHREWRRRNPDSARKHAAAYAAARRARKLQSSQYLKDHYRDEIRRIYARARELTRTTGEQYHVDHIIPLAGARVSGLHVPWNLQLLPARLNISKSNTFSLDAAACANIFCSHANEARPGSGTSLIEAEFNSGVGRSQQNAG